MLGALPRWARKTGETSRLSPVFSPGAAVEAPAGIPSL